MENSSLLQSGPRGLRTREQVRQGETRSGRRNSKARPQLRLRHQTCEFRPPPRAIVARARPMPTRARLTASARGDGPIPVQRTRRAEGGNQARPPVALQLASCTVLAPQSGFPAQGPTELEMNRTNSVCKLEFTTKEERILG